MSINITDEDIARFLSRLTGGEDDDAEDVTPEIPEPLLSKQELWEKKYDEERDLEWKRVKK